MFERIFSFALHRALTLKIKNNLLGKCSEMNIIFICVFVSIKFKLQYLYIHQFFSLGTELGDQLFFIHKFMCIKFYELETIAN